MPSRSVTRIGLNGKREPMSGSRMKPRFAVFIPGFRHNPAYRNTMHFEGTKEMLEPTEIRREQGCILEPVRKTPIVRDVDVLVCGGGPAGVGAALGAARTRSEERREGAARR